MQPSTTHEPRSVASGQPAPAAAVPTVRIRLKDRVWSGEQFLAETMRNPRQVAKLAKGGMRLEASPMAMAAIRASDFGRFVGDNGSIEPPQANSSLELGLAVLVLVLAAGTMGFAWGYSEGCAAGTEAATEPDDGASDEGDGGSEEGEGDDTGDGGDSGDTGDTGGGGG